MDFVKLHPAFDRRHPCGHGLLQDELRPRVVLLAERVAEDIELRQHGRDVGRVVRRRLAEGARAHVRATFGAARAAAAAHALYARLAGSPRRPWRWTPTGAAASAGAPGARAFVRSLGGAAPEFAASLEGGDPAACLEAERRIARGSPGLANAGAGGVLHYRSRYPDDPHLALGAGLLLAGRGRHALAAAELARAVARGLADGRVRADLALAAARAGNRALAAGDGPWLADARPTAADLQRARGVLEPEPAGPGGPP